MSSLGNSCRSSPGIRALVPLLIGVVALSCSGRRGPTLDPDHAGATMGVYRARIEDSASRPRKFRLLLFAESPDRVHGEIVSAMGTTELILDGGGGRLAVTLVRDGVSFVGPAGDDSLQRVLGIRLTLDQLVDHLLGRNGPRTDGPTRVREGRVGGLPTYLSLQDPDRSVTLDLRKLRPLRFRSAELGSGTPPEGTQLRPLQELELYEPLHAIEGVEDDP